MEKIRPVNPISDASAIADIYRWYVTDTTISFEVEPLSAEAMRCRIESLFPDFPYFVWEDNGRILGYCYAHPWKERSAYNPTLETTIYLAPEAQGRGIGTRLMQKLIEECRRRGYLSLIACVTADNEPSCVFHRSLGFHQVSLFRRVGRKFGRLLDVADFQLLL
ncbi:MAG: GNAT family N-acetyltransferase [Muribaculaceae bacterium]|nr:GNAT family N-acetyltransferase [Muribaculaceae bacterium]